MTNFGLDRGPSLNVSGAGDSQNSSDTENDGMQDCSYDGKPRGLVGLQNIGNTCYMNSAIQALSNTPPLTQYFLDCAAVVDFLTDSKKPGLSRSYQKLVREIWNRRTRGYVVPNGILYGIRSVHPMFRGHHQHDTQEFLRCFMDQLHEELKEPIRENKPARIKRPEIGYINRQPLQQGGTSNHNEISVNGCKAKRKAAQNKELINERARLIRFKKSSTRSFDNIPSATANLYSRIHTQSENYDNGNDFLPGHRRSASYCDPRGYAQLPQESMALSPRSASPIEYMDYDSSGKDDDDEETYETCDSGGSDSASVNGEDTFPSNKGYKRKSDSDNSDRHLSDSENTAENNAPNTVQFRSVISDVFDGRLLSSVQCLTCDRISTRVETFQDLSLPIPSKDHMAVLHSGRSSSNVGNLSNGSSNVGRNAACSDAVYSATSSQEGWIWWVLSYLRSWLYGPPITLHDCLAAFFSADELKGDNMYSCEKCNKLRNGVKFSKVLGLPEILCVHLKRFRHELSSSTKIGAKVSFPLTGLDMRPYLHKDCISTISTYDLVAVICHAGTAGGGHYTCVAKNQQAAQWFEFDDQYVTGITPEQVSSSEAYVLFYKKTNPRMEAIRMRAAELVESNELNDIKYFLSKQWINRFNTYAEPGPIDNSDFLCPHGGVSPDRVSVVDQLTVEVSQPLWEYLYQNFGGGPACNHLHCCSICLAEVEKLHLRQRTELEQFRTLHRNFTDNQEIVSALYAISMNWFRIWQAFAWNKTQQPPPPIDNTGIINPVQDKITSPPTVKPGSDYAQINEDVWSFFYDIYGGGPEVILKAAPVIQISNSVSQNYERSDYNSTHYPKSSDTVVSNYEQLSIKDSDNDENYDSRYTKSVSNTDLFTTVTKRENIPHVKVTVSLQDVSVGVHNDNTVEHKHSRNRELDHKKSESDDANIPNGIDPEIHPKNRRGGVKTDGKRRFSKSSLNRKHEHNNSNDSQDNTFRESSQKEEQLDKSSNNDVVVNNHYYNDVNDSPETSKPVNSTTDQYYNKSEEAVVVKSEQNVGVHQNRCKHKKSSGRKSKKQNGSKKIQCSQPQETPPLVNGGGERIGK